MPLVTRCPLWLYVGSTCLPLGFADVAMTLAVDSVLGSSVEVSGEEAAFRLKRPIDDRDPYDEGNGPRTDDGNEGRAEACEQIIGP
jgi:hypothetical protein